MMIRNYLKFDTQDFILDDDFQKWVQHPDPESDRFWTDLQKQHPEIERHINEAILIIRSFQAYEPSVPADRLSLIKEKIGNGSPPPRRIGFLLMKIAAGLVILIAIGGLIYNYLNRLPGIPFEAVSEEVKEKGKLILADGTVKEFDSDLTSIKQTAEGKLTLNNDTITENLDHLKSGKVVMNQVIIPYGKRSVVILADGTRIWLNSGTQFSYPAVFKGNTREVHLSGEAFFEVATEKYRPFIVLTGDLRVKVTGTKFNVCSYENDPETQVVLVDGKISSGRNKPLAKPVDLFPGDRLVFEKSTQNLIKDKVDAELYTSWVNGYLIFRNEPVSGIFRKLERYYNRQIVTVENMDFTTFSGKLDLKDDLGMVLNNISFTASFEVSVGNNIYTIKK